jgi:hypothetical protein
MCETCGCQAVPTIKLLTQEHDHLFPALAGEFPTALSRRDPSDWDAVDAIRVGSALPADVC